MSRDRIAPRERHTNWRLYIPGDFLEIRGQEHVVHAIEVIRDRRKIAQIENLLRGEGRFRDLLLFVAGINTALRISDLLELQVEHFLGDELHFDSTKVDANAAINISSSCRRPTMGWPQSRQRVEL